MYSGQDGGVIYRETGLKVSAITTIRETFNWACYNINGGQKGILVLSPDSTLVFLHRRTSLYRGLALPPTKTTEMLEYCL